MCNNDWFYNNNDLHLSSGMGIAILGSKIYIAGGHSGSVYLDTVQSYDPYTDTWTDENKMISTRCSFALVAI